MTPDTVAGRGTADTAAAPRRRTTAAEAVLWVMPSLYMIEVILGGPVSVAPRLRYFLFTAAFASLLALLLLAPRVRLAFLTPMLAIAGFIALNLAWAIAVPVLAGGDILLGLAEVRGYLALLLAVLFLAVARGRLEYFRRLQKLVVYSAVALATVQVMIWLAGTMVAELRGPIIFALRAVFTPIGLYVGPMPDGFFRVFWISSLWFLPAIFWVPDVVQRRGRRGIAGALLLLGVFVTYSRGIWLGLAVGWVLAAGVRAVRGGALGQLGRQVFAAGAAALLIGAVLATSGQLDRVTGRLLIRSSAGTDGSVSERMEQAHHLLEVWGRHPIIGAGYGAYSPDYVRDEAAPYTYENMPYALLAKLGLLGVLLYVGFFATVAVSGVLAAARTRRGLTGGAGLVGGLGAFFVAALTNPMLINFVGMSIVGCLLVQWAFLVAGAGESP